MIKISNVSFSYPGEAKKALDNINLEIKEGLIYALIGPNGSGKSTLVELIDGLMAPSSGEIEIDGLSTVNKKASDPVRNRERRDENDELFEIRRNLAITFQNPDNQIVGNTVERDIAFGPENLGLPREEILKRIDTVLKWTNLENHRFAEPHNLSGGQKQKLALASVLASQPKYLILDEPADMLDDKSRAEIIKILQSLNKRKNMTIIFTTHSLDTALFAKRIIVLNKGQIKAEFNTENLYENMHILYENNISLPFWAELAYKLIGKGLLSGRFKSMKTFGEAFCLSLKR